MIVEILLLVVAIVLFLVAAFSHRPFKVGLVPLGLACFAAALLVAAQTAFPGVK